jgi:LmbE family N-acetylglucosaminyl deacetylase
MGHPHERDWETLERMSADVIALWQGTRRAVVHLPLGVGHHVDHQLVFMLAGALRQAGIEVWHYEDFPYVAREPHALELRLAAVGAAYPARIVDVTAHVEQRLVPMALYTSQLEPTFARVGPYRDVTLAYAGSVVGCPGRYAERLWSLDRNH